LHLVGSLYNLAHQIYTFCLPRPDNSPPATVFTNLYANCHVIDFPAVRLSVSQAVVLDGTDKWFKEMEGKTLGVTHAGTGKS